MQRKNNGPYHSDSDPRWANLSANAKGTPTERERIESIDEPRGIGAEDEEEFDESEEDDDVEDDEMPEED